MTGDPFTGCRRMQDCELTVEIGITLCFELTKCDLNNVYHLPHLQQIQAN